MSSRDVYSALAEIIEKCTDSEFEGIKNFEFFSFKYPELVQEFSSDFTRIKSLGIKWNAFLREIKFWKEVGVEQMNRRLLQLCIRYIPQGQQFFKIENEIGSFTLPTRIDRLNKISLLAKDLLFDIYPRIESHVNFRAEINVEETRTIKGTINWNRTILNSINRGEKYPLQFSCITTLTKFDTQENFLAMFCLLKLQNDIDFLLFSESKPGEEFNFKEISLLKTLKNQVDNLVNHTKLQEIIPTIEQYKSLSSNSKFVSKLEEKTLERIRQGIVKQRSYVDLIDWLKKFRGYNVRTLSQEFTNFPIEHEKSIDTMYELWIIFEMVTYFEKQGIVFINALEKNGNFAGFKLKLENVVFNLNFQGRHSGWTEYVSEPDFTIEIEDSGEMPIVMDPKNWSTSQTGEAIHKMLGYLMNLSQHKARVGILFFSQAREKHLVEGQEPLPFVEKIEQIHGKDVTFTTMFVNPNETKSLETNLNKVFEYLQLVVGN